MKKIILFVLVLCLCFTVFGGTAFAETAAAEAKETETSAAEAPKAEMTAEELYQAAGQAYDAEDYGKAMEYFQLAADLGNAEGWRGIGYLYQYGLGVEQDYDKTLEYFSLAAEQGEPGAMFAIGECYHLGQGVKKDLDKAAKWYRRALDAGYEPDEEDQAHLKEVLGNAYQQQ